MSANLTTSSDTATKKTSERAQKRSNAIFGSGQGFVRFFCFLGFQNGFERVSKRFSRQGMTELNRWNEEETRSDAL